MTPSDEDLDFTQSGAAPPPPPTPQKVAAARTEASTGGPQLAKTGFYVAMARHATGGKVRRTTWIPCRSRRVGHTQSRYLAWVSSSG